MRQRSRRGSPDHHIVVIGGGFGGLRVVRQLRNAPVRVTLVDRNNYALFQPLAYQVATGALSAAEIATPLRAILKRQPNAAVVLGQVAGLDLHARSVHVELLPNRQPQLTLEYDTLVVATGARYSYFGHQEWQQHAPELKSLAGAMEIRSRILSAFEAAEVEQDTVRRRDWLTFVVVGAGPTGVEMAGQIAELAHGTLRRDFRSADPRSARVLLVEASDRVLATFPETLSRKAARDLMRIGVTPLVGHVVVAIDAVSVTMRLATGELRRVASRTVIWAAGVAASDLAATLASAAGAEVDRAGRVIVEPDLTLPGHPEVLALGDMAAVRTRGGGRAELPGVAPVAIQQGRYAARLIERRARGVATPDFRYRDKGNVATIGRSRAIADIHGLRLSGIAAWIVWLTIHLAYLMGFQNRLLVAFRWGVTFATRGRGARLIGHTRESHERAEQSSDSCDGRGPALAWPPSATREHSDPRETTWHPR